MGGAAQDEPRQRVLVTGAAGTVGRHLSPFLSPHYELTLLDRDAQALEAVSDHGQTLALDLADDASEASLHEACRGVDAIVHLAGNPYGDSPWEKLVGPNIHGLVRVVQAAAEQQVRTFVFASSIHTLFGYPKEDWPLPESTRPKVKNYYGLTKAFGEQLGQLHCQLHPEAAFFAIRIGGYTPNRRPKPWRQHPTMWLHGDDLNRLIQHCLDYTGQGFHILHSLSDLEHPAMDMQQTNALLAYQPREKPNLESLAPDA